MSEPRVSFTGRSRRHQNRWKVRAADIAARWIISIGGVATIVAVLLVLAFLISVTLPLFWPPASLAPAPGTPVEVAGNPVAMGLDEYQLLCWSIDESGELCVFRPDTGEVLSREPLVDEGKITAISASATGADVVLGLADGAIRVGTIATLSEFQASDEISAEWRGMAPGEVARHESGIVQRTPQGEWRVQRIAAEFGPAWSIAEGPIERLDHLSVASEGEGSKGPTILAWANSRPHLITTKRNELTGVLRRDTEHTLPTPNGWTEPPFKVLLTSQADNVLLVSQTGQVARIETRDPDQAQVVEQVPLVEQGQRLTLCQWVLGRETLLCGDDQGNVRAWFRVSTSEGGGQDGQTLMAVHDLPLAANSPSAVVAGDSSQRSRLVAIGFADGRIAIYHVTAERLVAESRVSAAERIRVIEFAPKEDGLVAWAGSHLWRFEFDPRHAEVTAGTLFGGVWYEGRSEPAHIWQSSFAGVDSEPKLGLWPLVFGTLKATLYSMLFGAPIALLAAVYASEFMSPKLRAQIKPTIEIMASLPSVVLGFLAALVLAPVVESQLASLLGVVLCTPLALLVGAILWQLLPAGVIPYLTPYRLLAIAAAFAAGVTTGIFAGPQLADLLFAGSIQRWLDGKAGSAVGGWFILVLPATAVAVTLVSGSLVNPWLRNRWGGIARTRFAVLNLLKFLGAGAVAVGLAWGVAAVLTAGGIDPRGTVVDTYVQRNALIVGFVMGFAIIPLVFTIADDALATVPQHLRSASLGAGATPWQTAIRIVIPTAMSGLFSAVMIGLGRAVGETMIVLMAGGNTPVMQWNVFNGFRTLSANIAVELPEAVRGSSHYRTLFLAALTLFLLTFVVNTAAELVRIRFRKRAYQL